MGFIPNQDSQSSFCLTTTPPLRAQAAWTTVLAPLLYKHAATFLLDDEAPVGGAADVAGVPFGRDVALV